MPYPCSTRSSAPRSATSRRRSKSSGSSSGAFRSTAASRLLLWVERFFRLWCRNQWKRERYAPSFHLDDENLDPKTWCRFPILSGGFERELAELRAYVAKNAKRRAKSQAAGAKSRTTRRS